MTMLNTISTEASKIDCEFIAAEQAQAPILAAMLASHLAELAAPTDYPYLSCYWQEPERYPFFTRLDTQIIGFALVREISPGTDFELAEFYIEEQARRRGHGAAAVLQLFSRFTGSWHLAVSQTNTAGLQFWRATLKGLAVESPASKQGYLSFHVKSNQGT